MSTGQDILNMMEVYFPELHNQVGEPDVAKSLTAINMAQDAFEVMVAPYEDVLTAGMIGNIVTTNHQERDRFPTNVLRINRLQFINPQNQMPSYDLLPKSRTGGHAWGGFWPFNFISNFATGQPSEYWTDGYYIYWFPVPSDAHVIRYYGTGHAPNITATSVITYDDAVLSPFALLACTIIRTGLDDNVDGLTALAGEVFKPTIEALTGFKHDGPKLYVYQRAHFT